MQPTLFQISGAPPSWRVRLGLAFKGIDADIRTITSAELTQDNSEILRLNPRGTLPILDTSTGPVSDSIAILAWLDRAFSGPELFGATPDAAADIWPLVMDACDYLRAANKQLLSIVFPSDGTVPDAESPQAEMLAQGAKLAHIECQHLDTRLAEGRPFLCGDHPTAAEAVIYPEMRLIQRAMETKPALMAHFGFAQMEQRYPTLAAWMDRLNAMPVVAETRPEHWTKT